MPIVDLVVEVHNALDELGMSHAFGGALALAYHAEPRGTDDIDVNVFLPFSERVQFVEAFAATGFSPEGDPEAGPPFGGIRLRRSEDPSPLAVFLSLDESVYGEIESRVLRFPFGADGTSLPFLSAEDLAVLKLSFNRDQDWVDLRRLVEQRGDLDLGYIERQLVALRGPLMYQRTARLRALARNSAAPGTPEL
ncbi:MAG: hypothetical protein M0035_08150 [Actinomycetota bacterium]|nr:hypothetical protein [Actinomycetota bacterium]